MIGRTLRNRFGAGLAVTALLQSISYRKSILCCTNLVSSPAEPEAVGFQKAEGFGVSVNGCVTGAHSPKLSVGDDRAIDLADNVSDAFWSNLGAVLAIPRNFAMVARPERC